MSHLNFNDRVLSFLMVFKLFSPFIFQLFFFAMTAAFCSEKCSYLKSVVEGNNSKPVVLSDPVSTDPLPLAASQLFVVCFYHAATFPYKLKIF